MSSEDVLDLPQRKLSPEAIRDFLRGRSQARWLARSYVAAFIAVIFAELVRVWMSDEAIYSEAYAIDPRWAFAILWEQWWFSLTFLVFAIGYAILGKRFRRPMKLRMALVQFAFTVVAAFHWFDLVTLLTYYLDDWPMNVGGGPLTGDLKKRFEMMKWVAIGFWPVFAAVHGLWLRSLANAVRPVP